MRTPNILCLSKSLCWCWLAMASLATADESHEFSPPPIQVPNGFDVELAAAPPLVKHPMMACLDESGRLFIAESRGRNLEKEELLEQRGRFIRMLEDTDADGRFDKSTIFADQLVMPEGALWHQGALYVLSSPYLWRFEDTDDDGVADKRDRLVGYMEFNGKANQHGAYLGPNGRLYFSGGTFGYDLIGSDGKAAAKGSAAGVFSCRADGTDVEVFGTGGINPVEVAFTPEGELITTCAIFDNIDGRHDALIHWVRGGAAAPVDFKPPVLKQTGYRLPALSRWGQVAPSGLVRYRGLAFGTRYQNTFFTALFNTATVINTRIERMGSTFRSYDEDFLTSASEDFHPTDVLEDADGSLLVIDTGGWFRISCPASEISKPLTLGAIYRVRRKGAAKLEDPRGLSLAWDQATDDALMARLDDPRPVVRDRAIGALTDRGDKAADALRGALAVASVQKRRNAVWALSRIGTATACDLIRHALSDADTTVRQAAVRSAGSLKDHEAVPLLLEILAADAPPLRRAAATALGQIGDSLAVPLLLRSAESGGDDFFMHALVYALIEIGDFELTLEGLHRASALVQHTALVALNQLAPTRLTQEHVAPLLESDDATLRRTALEIVTSRAGWNDQIIAFLESWTASAHSAVAEATLARGAIVAFSADNRVQTLIVNALVSESTSPGTRAVVLESIGRLEQLPDAWIEPIGNLLQTTDHATRFQAISTITSLATRKLDRELLELAEDPTTNQRLRAAAWSCLAVGGLKIPDDGFRLLLGRVNDDEVPPFERLDAARALASANLDRAQLGAIADKLTDVGPLELPVLIGAFRHHQQSDSELGTRLLNGLARSRGASGLSPSSLRQLLAAFPEQIQRDAAPILTGLGADDREMATRMKEVTTRLVAGNAEHGKIVFFSNRAACSACHRVHGEGGTIGPDLSHIAGVRSREDLLQSILFPNSSIVNNYETYSVITIDGRIFEGVIQRATSRSIVLRNAQRQELVVARDDIGEIVRSKTSIMPQGLDQTIRIEELSDLLAFLESLRP